MTSAVWFNLLLDRVYTALASSDGDDRAASGDPARPIGPAPHEAAREEATIFRCDPDERGAA